VVTVGKGGVVTDPKSFMQFSDPSKFTGGVHYYN
jgi:hypothetical protein